LLRLYSPSAPVSPGHVSLGEALLYVGLIPQSYKAVCQQDRALSPGQDTLIGTLADLRLVLSAPM
ncbi:hypothetical protein KIPB_016865, partial [Kipferlia bialata]